MALDDETTRETKNRHAMYQPEQPKRTAMSESGRWWSHTWELLVPPFLVAFKGKPTGKPSSSFSFHFFLGGKHAKPNSGCHLLGRFWIGGSAGWQVGAPFLGSPLNTKVSGPKPIYRNTQIEKMAVNVTLGLDPWMDITIQWAFMPATHL